MSTEAGPLTRMARDVYTRNHEFQEHTTSAMLMVDKDPAGALNALEAAEREGESVEQARLEFDRTMDDHLAQIGQSLSLDVPQARQTMATAWAENRIQIKCAEAQALILLMQFPEARKLAEEASAECPPNASRELRSMLLQLQATLTASS